MTRTAGARNADYEGRRAALLAALRQRLSADATGRPSLRELAASAGVSVPTLRHYFGDRDAVVAAVLDAAGESGAPFVAVAAAPRGPFAASVRGLLSFAQEGHRRGVGDLHTIGLREGLRHADTGPAYLQSILEPTLQAVETRLRAHMAAGEMRQTDPRHAALALMAPVILAGLHQHELGGGACRPLDADAFLDDHAAAFVRAHAAARDGH